MCSLELIENYASPRARMGDERADGAVSTALAVQERERTQYYAENMKSNSCYETHRPVRHIANRERSD